MILSLLTNCVCVGVCVCVACACVYSVRLRKNSSIHKPKDSDETKKGQRLIEKETMETGQVSYSHSLSHTHRLRHTLTNSLTHPPTLTIPSLVQVKFSLYIQYLSAMGWVYSSMVFLVYFIQNIAFIGQNLWLSDWTNDAVEYFNMTYPTWKRDTRVGVFGVLGVAQGNHGFHPLLFVINACLLCSCCCYIFQFD